LQLLTIKTNNYLLTGKTALYLVAEFARGPYPRKDLKKVQKETASACRRRARFTLEMQTETTSMSELKPNQNEICQQRAFDCLSVMWCKHI
jgi:hypothetical protein